MTPLIQDIKNHKIKPNTTKQELSALKSLKEQPNIEILLSDKINKLCIIDQSIVKEKLMDHAKSGCFKELQGDPSGNIEIQANYILEDLRKLNGFNIPEYHYAHFYTHYSQSPKIYPKMKDHKEIIQTAKSGLCNQ